MRQTYYYYYYYVTPSMYNRHFVTSYILRNTKGQFKVPNAIKYVSYPLLKVLIRNMVQKMSSNCLNEVDLPHINYLKQFVNVFDERFFSFFLLGLRPHSVLM